MSDTADLRGYLDASPTPFHAVAEAARRLEAAGFTRLDLGEAWDGEPGGRYVVRGGTLIAWQQPRRFEPAAGLRILGAHTDSPNLRLKPHPQTRTGSWTKLAVEVYGGAIWASWLDRDLGLAGQVVTRDGTEHLLRIDRPLLRVPSVAIHLDRSVNSEGMKLDPQRHLDPVLACGDDPVEITELIAEAAGVSADQIVASELMCHDTTPAATLGYRNEMLASGRLDNLVSCWAALQALTGAAQEGPIGVVVLFDHEEIGSVSATGASSVLASTVTERIASAAGAGREDWLRAMARSWAVSADGAHATHPNRPELHDPGHEISLDGGPVIKHNANVRYATDAAGDAWISACADDAGVPTQHFVMRNDMPCGSTIGPLTSAGMGITTVDVGVAQLSMHSARELCSTADPGRLARLLGACLER